ncbi:DNA repair protein RecN (Recombination protein N) [Desulfohalotomaculum tongense]|uniref:DNA repair protein RecN n=1 Tax=Desulforadius tongensis TaxID=1216062 RepID=UPI001958461D|nr:DNA repair protein RecN [Desulforadius tongensis]MBM7855505.1 DNA repair protein RecN (Recombination protein N) [Desulforadius tongensis]
MLHSLYIKNFALIDDITVEFEPGFNVLTGETGAGKSILLDALQVALGGRASAEYIRAGKDKAVVQAAFQTEHIDLKARLESLGLEPSEDGLLILSREISRSGRNWCRVNGQVVTLAMYRQAGAGLVDLHSQHQQQSLLDPERHLDLLDSFGGRQITSRKEQVAEYYHRWQQLENRLRQLQNNARDIARQIDMLQFQAQEIEKANLAPGEDNQLMDERNVLANAEKISLLGNTVRRNLYSGGGQYSVSAVELIGEAVNSLRELTQYDKKMAQMLQSLEEALYTVEDVAREISGYLDNVEYDPQRLDYIEKRLDEINRLKKKYGESVAEILSYHKNILNQLDELSGSEEQLDELKQQREKYYRLWKQEAEALSNLRREMAEKMQQKVTKELAALEMGKVRFKVGFQPLDKPTPKGMDEVQFLIATNPGEPLKPLHKIASGGELSRFMLAVKCLLAGADKVPTLIFDEVDTGIGGRALRSVGEKMAQIGQKHQVITVTHAPQVACFARNHYLIKKEVLENRTYTSIKKLDYRGRVNELTRMLGGGDSSNAVLEHAEELLKSVY